MNKRIRKIKKSNQGNSFIIVIATLSFLAVLTTALLVAVGICYRMKAYDINSKDNFYYLEQAMDELYEGVGAIAMKHLNEAYNDVTDVIVVYDAEKKAYVTMDNDDANEMLNMLFMDKLKSDDSLKSSKIADTLQGFLTHSLANGVQLSSIGNTTTNDNSLTIEKIVLRREAQYSTVNTNKEATKTSAPATYVQTITTDMVIAAPKFAIDFSSIDNDDLFDFVMISDMGVEIEKATTKSVINGNIYAANDFYNKDYNYVADTNVTPYEDGDSALNDYDGLTEKSMYSGLYVDKAKVSIIADRIIVPGSIAAMNCAQLSIVGSGKSDESDDHKLAQVWTDNMIIGGYAKKTGASTTAALKGADLEMVADAYVSDDLELNANGSKYVLDGNYYGYNNATTDKRSYSRAYLSKVLDQTGGRTISRKSDVTIKNGNYVYKAGTDDEAILNLPGQSHYNSSSIVVNGQNSELDLAKTDAMYIAGQAYIEMSKDTKAAAFAVRTSGEDDNIDVTELEEGVTADDVKEAEKNPYSFKDKSNDDYSSYHESAKKQDDGTVDYSVEYSDGTAAKNKRVEDYRTGEGLSVKSNQLAYIPPYAVTEDEDTGKAYVSWPKLLQNEEYFKDLFTDLTKVPVVKTVVSGKKYYFYDFTNTDIKMDEYIRHYAELFSVPEGAEAGTRSKGDLADLYDITKWEQFEIGSILINEDADNKLYSNSAISVKKDTDSTLRVIADSKKIDPLFKVNDKLGLSQTLAPTGTNATPLEAATVTSDLQKRYKSLKVLLTDKPTAAAAKNDVNAAVDTSITPINTYFDFTKLNDTTKFTGTQKINNSGEIKNDGSVSGAVILQSNYQIYESDGDVEVSAPAGSDGKVMGVVICKGDVTFDSNVKEFHGLIVAGGKIKVDHSINFVANREIVKAVLDECEGSTVSELNNFLSLFKHYNRTTGSASDEKVKSMKNVSSVEYEDVLGFSNWQKNVN